MIVFVPFKGTKLVFVYTDVQKLVRGLLEAIVEGRVEDVISCYAPSASTYVFLEGPRSSTRGIERIAEGWRAFVESPLEVASWRWVEGPFEDGTEELAWLAGELELGVRSRGDESPGSEALGSEGRRVRLRASYVARRSEDDGGWRIVHEHVSLPAEDPYGMGDWLKGSAGGD